MALCRGCGGLVERAMAVVFGGAFYHPSCAEQRSQGFTHTINYDGFQPPIAPPPPANAPKLQGRAVMDLDAAKRLFIEDMRLAEEEERQALHYQTRTQAIESQRRAEEQRRLEGERQRAIQSQMQWEEQRRLEGQRQLALQEQRQLEEQRKLEADRQRALQLQRQFEEQQRLEGERQRALQQRQLDEQRRLEVERQRAFQKQLQLEEQRKLEMERDRIMQQRQLEERRLESERQRALQQQQQLEAQRRLEQERQRTLQQQQLEDQRRIEGERQRQQRQLEEQRRLGADRQRLLQQRQLEEQQRLEGERQQALQQRHLEEKKGPEKERQRALQQLPLQGQRRPDWERLKQGKEVEHRLEFGRQHALEQHLRTPVVRRAIATEGQRSIGGLQHVQEQTRLTRQEQRLADNLDARQLDDAARCTFLEQREAWVLEDRSRDTQRVTPQKGRAKEAMTRRVEEERQQAVQENTRGVALEDCQEQVVRPEGSEDVQSSVAALEKVHQRCAERADKNNATEAEVASRREVAATKIQSFARGRAARMMVKGSLRQEMQGLQPNAEAREAEDGMAAAEEVFLTRGLARQLLDDLVASAADNTHSSVLKLWGFGPIPDAWAKAESALRPHLEQDSLLRERWALIHGADVVEV